MPKGIITRLIVPRQHQIKAQDLVWALRSELTAFAKGEKTIRELFVEE